MSAEQLATRILSDQARISSSDIRRGNIHDSQYATLVETSQMISELPLFIDDTGGLSIAQLMARARRLKRQKGLDLIIIDYVQLLSGSSRRANENRVQELTEITTSLKALAKELEVPIIALAQLSRQVEIARRQAAATCGFARIRFDRAGCRRGPVHLPRRILPQEQGAAGGHARTSGVAGGNGKSAMDWPMSSSASSATDRPAP